MKATENRMAEQDPIIKSFGISFERVLVVWHRTCYKAERTLKIVNKKRKKKTHHHKLISIRGSLVSMNARICPMPENNEPYKQFDTNLLSPTQ